MTQSPISQELLASEVMAIDYETLEASMEKDLQMEYSCLTTTELTLARVAAVSYTRYLIIQEQIKECTDRLGALWYHHETCKSDEFRPYNTKNACKRNSFELDRYQVLSKESDRAFRQYVSSLQMLRMMKQGPMKITVQAQAAFIGQTQQVQTNHLTNHATII